MKEILERVSVRKYEARPVEREKLEALLRAAMAASSRPSASWTAKTASWQRPSLFFRNS